MKRRGFMALLAGAAASPLAARAQAKLRMRRVGVLMIIAEHDPEGDARMAAFRGGLKQLGWIDGQNVRLEYRWAGGEIERINQYAKELVAQKPDVILGNGTPAVAALQKLTRSIPIVCALVTDPVGLGFVASLSRPGGNITGFTFIDAELIGKWVELLKEAAPATRRSALLFNPKNTPFYYGFLKSLASARRTAGLQITPATVENDADLEAVVAASARTPGGSLILGPDPFTVVHIRKIAQLAAQSRLPSISVYRQFVVGGGLMSYGPDTADIFRRSASYIDRILKGANPAELPVQQPAKFVFVVNLKAAKSLGLKMPAALLAQVDEVVE
jgi:putative ABC transport system substrate-binding protein